MKHFSGTPHQARLIVQTRLKRLLGTEKSSLLLTFINYTPKTFYNFGSRLTPAGDGEVHPSKEASQDSSSASPSIPELGDIMDVLLGQLDISWLDPDPATTLDILNIILTLVNSFQDEHVEEPPHRGDDDDEEEEGALTKLVLELVESDRLLESSAEDEEVEPCPEEGFHREQQQEEEGEENKEETEEIATKQVSILYIFFLCHFQQDKPVDKFALSNISE